MLLQLFSYLRVAYVASVIESRHKLLPIRDCVYHHPLETKLFEGLNKSHTGIFVHWGVYESGKSTAVKNMGLRLQDEGRSVILLHGYNFEGRLSMYSWLRNCIGVSDDSNPMSTYFRKPTTIVIDHFDLFLSSYADIFEFLRELAVESAFSGKFNVLLVVTSWEWAVKLRDNGCIVIGSPSRWTGDELAEVFSTMPQVLHEKCQDKHEVLRVATLSGTPGFLTMAAHGAGVCSERASIIDREWHMGIRALEGKSLDTDEGRFPDINGKFHWEDLR